MPSRRGASTSSGKGPLAPRSRARPSVRSANQRALIDASAALGLAGTEEDIARLTASAVASTLSAPLGAVVLHGEDRPSSLVVGQLRQARGLTAQERNSPGRRGQIHESPIAAQDQRWR